MQKLFGSHLVNIDVVPEGGVVIDAGACQGNFIKSISACIKDLFFFAIEPNKTNTGILTAMSDDYDIITIEAALVGKKEPDRMLFAEFEGLPEWGNVTGMYSSRKHKKYEVETITIKELLDIIPQDTIHLLKMDIENSEFGVINDITKDQSSRIQQITMEVHGHGEAMENKLKWLGYDTFFKSGELYAAHKGL